MKRLMLSLIMIFTIVGTYAQRDSLAMIRFQEAENAYRNDQFERTVTLLETTEQLLGKSNSKILYLKIRGLDEIYKAHSNFSAKMDEALKAFFSMVNNQTYPAEKLSEIEKIRQRFTDFQKADKLSYQMAQTSGTLEAIQTHFKNFPSTFFQRESDSLKLVINDKQRRLIVTANKMERQSLIAKANKLNNRATGKTIKGSFVLIASLGTAAYTGLKAYDYYFVKIQKDNTPEDYSNVGKTPPDLVKEYEKMAIVYGSTALASALVGVPLGLSSLKKASRLRQQAGNIRRQANKIEITALPYVSPLSNSYGLTFHAKF